MLHLYKRGRIFWARGSIHGRRIRRSLDTSERNVALDRRRMLEQEIWSGGRIRPKPWSVFQAEFLALAATSIRPLTIKKYRFVIERFSRFIRPRGDPAMQSFTPSDISAYLAARSQDVHPTRRRRIGPEGLHSDLRVLHRVFSEAVRLGLAESNPVSQGRRPARGLPTQPFSDDEVKAMLAACDSRPRRGDPYPLKPIVLTFIYTGLRISDVTALRWRDLDLAAGRITLQTRKVGSVVSIPIHPELAAALQKHFGLSLVTGHWSLVFPTASGRPLNSLDAYLQRLWRHAGVVHGHPHRFRDTFAIRLLSQGASLYDVAKLLGTTVKVCEQHYAPYVSELQARARLLVESLPSIQPETVPPQAQPPSSQP